MVTRSPLLIANPTCGEFFFQLGQQLITSCSFHWPRGVSCPLPSLWQQVSLFWLRRLAKLLQVPWDGKCSRQVLGMLVVVSVLQALSGAIRTSCFTSAQRILDGLKRTMFSTMGSKLLGK